MARTTEDKHAGLLMLAAAIAFAAITAIAIAILHDTAPALRTFATDPARFFGSAVNANASALPLATAVFGLAIAVISVWSLVSVLIAEAVLLVNAGRGSGLESAKTLLRFSSPLVRPLLKKRIAALALSATIVASGPAAFADSAPEVPTDLSWQAASTVPTDLSITDPAGPSLHVKAAGASEAEPSEAPAPPAEQSTAASTASGAAPATSTGASALPEDVNNRAPVGARSTPSFSASAPSSRSSAEEGAATQPQLHAAADSSSGTYVVQPGDSLWTISSRYFETSNPTDVSSGWKRIYELNKHVIEDPNLIHPGLTLQMPEKEL